MIDYDKNWLEFKKELDPTNREGVFGLLSYLEHKTDFIHAPASTKFHLDESGGLVLHTLHVLKYARLVNKELGLNLPEESVTLVALFHDICKANFYVQGEEWDKEIKEKENRWQKKAVWKVDDQLPLGHGEKSVILASRYVDLTVEEMCAIRWHMASTDPGTNFFYPSGAPYKTALDKYPLVKLLIIADQMAELSESNEELAEKGEKGQ